MIIWGFDGNYKQLGEGPIGKCENCNNVVVFQVIQQSRRFKLYFVPVLKYNSQYWACLLYTSPSPRDTRRSRMPSSA